MTCRRTGEHKKFVQAMSDLNEEGVLQLRPWRGRNASSRLVQLRAHELRAVAIVHRIAARHQQPALALFEFDDMVQFALVGSSQAQAVGWWCARNSVRSGNIPSLGTERP